MKIELGRTYMEAAEQPMLFGTALTNIDPDFQQDTVMATVTEFDEAFRQKVQDAAYAQLSEYWDTFNFFKKDDGETTPDWGALTEDDVACFNTHAKERYGYIRYTPTKIIFFGYLSDIDQDKDTDWLDILPFIKQFTTEKAPA